MFDRELVGLIRQDRATTPAGDEGLLGVDPICDCQDWDHLTVDSVDVQSSGPGQAQAAVAFTNGADHVLVRYDLVNVGGRWLIHDIQNRSTPSLRKFLIDGLAERRAKPRGR